MSDFMASAFATFLDNRKTKHNHHHSPAPPITSAPFTSTGSPHDVLHPPLQPPPPFQNRKQSAPAFNDLLHETALPTSRSSPPPLQLETTNFMPAKHIPKSTYVNSHNRCPNSTVSSDKAPANAFGTLPQRTSNYPRDPMIGGVPLLNSHHSTKQPSHNLLSDQTQPTLWPPAENIVPIALRTSSLSDHTLSLLNETPTQKPRNTTPRPFACRHEGCSASFIKQNHLSRHIRIVHNKERPYHCTEPGCGSRFGSKSHLGDHTRAVHMRIKLFKCELCNASWSKRFNLKKHIRVRHLGEKPFRCQQCQLSFGTRSHATRHELKVHKRSFAGGLAGSERNLCT